MLLGDLEAVHVDVMIPSKYKMHQVRRSVLTSNIMEI